MTTTLIEAQGHNGQLELTDTVLRIKRKGALAFMTQGFKGDKEILISKISSIQFKNANAFMNGYIQFSFIGGSEAKGGFVQATQDENSVLFRANQQAAVEVLRDELQRRISSETSKSLQTSSMDELEKLAVLRDKGVVSEEEFQQKKKMLLGF